ncbi:MAG: erythromycin esterase family protein [Bacteroidales bacterium]
MPYTDRSFTRVNEKEITEKLKSGSHDLHESLDPLFDRIGNAKIVLLGEASHGTHEYYAWRSKITRHLIKEKGFNIIGVEGDWPDCYKINRFVRGYENGGNTAPEVLGNFHRWPTWMWANWEIASLMDWLKEFNKEKSYEKQAGFYGLDVYSLWESLDAILDYLRKNDPDALKTAENAMECFEPYDMEGSEYASATTAFVPESCEEEVLDLLKKIRARIPMYNTDPEGPFNTEQNALTAVNAERYYRAMIAGGSESWNIRDVHMTDTLERLMNHMGPEAKAIVWEHNTHVGDARATDMQRSGVVNVGQLVREKWGISDTVAVGFGSYQGSVIAGNHWGAKMKVMEVPPAREASWEALLHEITPYDKLLISNKLREIPALSRHIHHRAIGVVYHPESERYGNYVPSIIPERYDAFIFIDKTRALHPIPADPDKRRVPETYPFEV